MLYKQYKLQLNFDNIPELGEQGTCSWYHANKTAKHKYISNNIKN